MAFRTNLMPTLQEKTASGSVASFNCALNKPLVACTTEFMCTQEGSGDPSPSNVRNIVGVDDITLTVNGNTIVIDLEGTLYGGTLELINGVFHAIITHGSATFNGSESWQYRSASDSARLGYVNMKIGSYQNGMCDIFPLVRDLNTFGIVFGVVNNSIYVNKIANLGCTSINEFKAWLTTHNMNIVYPLATPIDMILSDIPTPTTIIGNNSFASDSGDISLTYNDLDIAKRGSFREVFKLPS